MGKIPSFSFFGLSKRGDEAASQSSFPLRGYKELPQVGCAIGAIRRKLASTVYLTAYQLT